MTLSMHSSDVQSPPQPAQPPKAETPEEKARESLLATMNQVQTQMQEAQQQPQTVDKFTNLEKFETGVPEPFEEDDLQVGAPF
jgi:hypothetical protein